jgi:peptidoglycan hydrolase-like protein with peptidoglycan-binding domain
MQNKMLETIQKLRLIESQEFLAEALTPEEEKQLADLMAKHKAKFDDGEFMASMPKDVQDKVNKVFTLQKQAPTADKAADAEKPAAAGADPKVKSVQEKLAALGFQVGKTGADGKMGPATIGAIKAFEKFAGKTPTGKITPELEQMLANGEQIKSNNEVVKALTALEALVKKHAKTPQTQSVDVSDIDSMTESELRSFVLSNMKYLTLSEQMTVMSLVLTEAPLPSQLDAANARFPGASGGTLPTQAQAAAARYPGSAPAAAPAGTAQAPGMLDKLKTFGKNLAGRITGVKPGAAPAAGTAAVKAGAKTAGKMALRLVPGLGWGLLAFDIIGAISDTMKDSGIPDADKQAITQNLEILKKFSADKDAASSMPADVQKRITDVLKAAETIGSAPAAAPAPTAQPAAGSQPVVAP